MKPVLVILFLLLAAAVSARAEDVRIYDLIMRGGTVYDGSGGKPFVGDVAVQRRPHRRRSAIARRSAKAEDRDRRHAGWRSRPASSTC